MPRKQVSDKGAPEGMVLMVERGCVINCIVPVYKWAKGFVANEIITKL